MRLYQYVAPCFDMAPTHLAQNQRNTYKVRKARDYNYSMWESLVLSHDFLCCFQVDLDDGDEVTLTSANEAIYPLPDPRYLAFHAAVAKIVHMAGMAEHLENILRDRENIRVLSDDSGVEYFEGLLRIAQQSIVVN